jgi:hypothetical protein
MNGGAQANCARAATDMASVPAAGRDAQGYGMGGGGAVRESGGKVGIFTPRRQWYERVKKTFKGDGGKYEVTWSWQVYP